MQRSDVRVIELREELGFSLETIQTLFVCRELFRKNLDRYVPPELRVPRSVHFSHPAFTDGREDLVVGECVTRFEGHVRATMLRR